MTCLISSGKLDLGELDFPPHSQIPTEMLLAESLGVGRLALREAMKALAARGLVRIRPMTGTQVLPREHWNLIVLQVLLWLVQTLLGSKFLDDLIELRRAIAPPLRGGTPRTWRACGAISGR